MFRLLCSSIVLLLLIPSLSIAEIKTIYASHEYVMGDNDSKNDARHMCFLEAKRRALEKAGTYISSHTVAKDMQLTKDEVVIYSAALLKVETVKEEWKMIGENMAIFMTVKADVDTKIVEDQLSKIKGDEGVQSKIIDQQEKLKELEDKLTALQSQLFSANSTKATVLRTERKVVFDDIDEISKRYEYVMNLFHDRRVSSIELAHRIINHIEIGMTVKEVEYILGIPDFYILKKPHQTITGYISGIKSKEICPNCKVEYLVYGNIIVNIPSFTNATVYNILYVHYWFKYKKEHRASTTIIKNVEYNVLKQGLKSTKGENYCGDPHSCSEIRNNVIGNQ